MIVISNPVAFKNEANLIHSLFAEGLALFHIRKPDFSEADMKAFVSEIGLEFSERLVLHNHHHLAEAFEINRIHFSEKMRNETMNTPARFSKPCRYSENEILDGWKRNGFTLSTSIHKMDDYETLSTAFDYAFLSPVFGSISKPDYVSAVDFETEVKNKKNNKTALVALGGIAPNTIKTAYEYGFDAVALLGTIWNSNSPIENFKTCQKIALSH
jgi:thiamine-phosphate pyrophosphorylase